MTLVYGTNSTLLPAEFSKAGWCLYSPWISKTASFAFITNYWLLTCKRANNKLSSINLADNKLLRNFWRSLKAPVTSVDPTDRHPLRRWVNIIKSLLQCSYSIFYVIVDYFEIKVMSIRLLQKLTFTHQTF